MTDTQQDRIDALIASMQRTHDEHGTSARCPTCNAGRGRWCLAPDGSRPSDHLILHPERVALAQKEGVR